MRPVLVVEDEALIGMEIEDELSTAGYNIAGPFATCAQALTWLAGATPALAVLDTILRDGPCTELAQEPCTYDSPMGEPRASAASR